ncbi:hypothetical protein VNO78_35192 [Psophocarpus tetragonolobus]|uniref:Uncharacterized protein n=1 Tax=Psophocarpus tetragonolobus TaxID=3891 RepID=A0AAN9NCL2_PSOTE
MEELIADFIGKMGLAVPLALLLAVRAGQMFHQRNSLNMETRVTDLAIDVVKDKIVDLLSILFRIYRDTTPDLNLPTGVNLQDVSERLFFRDEGVQCLNQIYLDLVNQGTHSPHFAQALEYVLSL